MSKIEIANFKNKIWIKEIKFPTKTSMTITLNRKEKYNG
jgi:hypothetical protein